MAASNPLTYRRYDHLDLPHCLSGKLPKSQALRDLEVDRLDELIDHYGVWNETVLMACDGDNFTMYFRYRRVAMRFMLNWTP